MGNTFYLRKFLRRYQELGRFAAPHGVVAVLKNRRMTQCLGMDEGIFNCGIDVYFETAERVDACVAQIIGTPDPGLSDAVGRRIKLTVGRIVEDSSCFG